MRAPVGLGRYLREDDKDRDKTGRFSEGSGLARYLKNSDTARSAGSEGRWILGVVATKDVNW